MIFMHKLSRRLAMLKDAMPVVVLAGLAVASCKFPERRAGPEDPHIARLIVAPSVITLHVAQSTAITAKGQNAAGDAAPVLVTFRVQGTSGGRIIGMSTPAMGEVDGEFQAGPSVGLDSVIAADTSGFADTMLIVVAPLPVASVVVAPAAATVLLGVPASFTATLYDSAGGVLTGRSVSWTSTNTGVATISGAGVATSVALGSTSIIATSETKSDTATLTVVNVPVASVTIAPATASIFVGQTQAFTATLRDSAGGILTGRVVTWSSTATTVATVNSSGVVTARAAGTASIIASSGGQSDTATVTVAIVPVASLTLTPASATINVGATQAFTATLRDSAGGIITGPTVTWSSTATTVATVSTSGVATGVSAGSASIIASSGGKSDTSALTVVSVPVVASVTIAPATASIFVGQ